MEDAIQKTLTVPLDRHAAFDLFTDGIDRWWPKDTHSLSGRRDARVSVEPEQGGRVYETKPDGTEALWGTVTHWDPGTRFGLSWFVGTTPEKATQVDVVFTQTEAGTRIDLTHFGWAAKGKNATVAQARYETGWDKVLGQCFGEACQAMAVT